MTIYETLDDCPLYNWDKFMTQDNDNWLIQGFDGRQPIVKDDKLTEIAIKLKDEYFVIAGGDMFVQKLQKGAKRDYLLLKYDTIKHLLELLMNDAVINNAETRLFCIQQLRKFGYNLPEINDYEGDVIAINGVISSMDGIITQIHIIDDDLKRENAKSNLNKELILVSMGLNLSYSLDSKKITVGQWLEYISILKQKNEIESKNQ